MNVCPNNFWQGSGKWVFFFFLSLMLFTGSGHIGGDSMKTYYTVESLVIDGDLDISNIKPTFDVKEMQGVHRRTRQYIADMTQNGLRPYYSEYGSGMVLAFLPWYLLGHALHFIIPLLPHDYYTIFMVSLLNCLLLSILCTYCWAFAMQLGAPPSIAWLLSLALGTGTFVWTYGVKGGGSELLQAVGLFGAFYHSFCFRKQQLPSQLYSALILMGIAVLAKFYSFVILPFLLMYTIYPLFTRRFSPTTFNKMIGYGLGIGLVFIVLFFGYNYMRFGQILETGYGQLAQKGAFTDINLVNIFTRLYGLTFSIGKGLFIFAPILLLNFWVFYKFFRLWKAEALVILGIMFFFMGLMCISPSWHADFSWGPRYLLPFVPFLILPISIITRYYTHRHGRNLVLCGLIIGGIVQLPSVFMNTTAYIRFTEKADIWDYRWFIPNVSPILGGYYQIASGVHRSITGESLEFPVLLRFRDNNQYNILPGDPYTGSYKYYSLAGYDDWDIWWLTAWNFSTNWIFRMLTLMTMTTLLATAVLSCNKISHRVKIGPDNST
jgi:hypothetical protein